MRIFSLRPQSPQRFVPNGGPRGPPVLFNYGYLDYAMQAQLEIAGISENDFLEYLDKLFLGYDHDKVYMVARIFKKYSACQKKFGKKQAFQKIKGSELVLEKMKSLWNFLRSKTEKKIYTPKTLQVHKDKKRGSYIHTSRMSQKRFLNYIMRLVIGSSSTDEAGSLKKDFKMHSVFVTGWYLHHLRKKDSIAAHTREIHVPAAGTKQIVVTMDKASNFSLIHEQIKGTTKCLTFFKRATRKTKKSLF